METRANYLVVGVFVLAVIAGGFSFAWWLLRGSEISERAEVTVIFPVAVNGLGTGSAVTFNGIRVGEVKRLEFSKEDPNLVIALASVDRHTPLKKDTSATLGLAGLTGGTLIQLSGGSIDSPALINAEEPAVIIADRSELQDVVTAARNVLTRADRALQAIETLTTENGPGIGRIVKNAETFTDALAKNADGVDAFMANVGRAAQVLEKVSDKVEGLVNDVGTLVRAVPPDVVTRFVQNADKIATDIARASGEIDGIIADVKSATTSLKDAGGTIKGAADEVQRVVAGVDPDKVKSIVDDVAGTAAYLRTKQGDIDAILSRGAQVLADAQAFAAKLAERGDDVAEIIANARRVVAEVDPAKIREAVDGFTSLLTDTRNIVAAVEPDKVKSIVDDVAGTAAYLRTKQGDFDAILSRGAQVLADAQAFAAKLVERSDDMAEIIANARRVVAEIDPVKIREAVDGFTNLLTNTRDIVAAVEPSKVRQVVEDIANTTDYIRSRQGDITDILSRTRKAIADAESFISDLAARRADVSIIINEVKRIVSEVTPGTIQKAVESLDSVMADASALMGDARKVVAAVEPDRVRTALDDLAETATFLKTKAKDVDDILGGGKRVMNEIETFSGVLGKRSADVDQIIVDAKAIAETLKAASARVDGVLTGVETMVTGDEGKGLIAEATAAAKAIREAAQAFELRAAQIAGGIDRITGKGLRDIEGLVTDGRRALTAVERAASEIERNPQRFIYGGTKVPEYAPNRR